MTNIRQLLLTLGLAGLAGCLPPAAPRPLYSELPKPAVEVTATSLVLNQAIFFEFDQDKILPISFAILDEVARTLRQHPELSRVRVEGHTDNVGTPAYNLSLSQRRAQSVASYLIAQGVDGSRLSTRGAGPDQPIASNATPDGRAQNRRVEVTLRPLPGAQQQAPQSGQYQQY